MRFTYEKVAFYWLDFFGAVTEIFECNCNIAFRLLLDLVWGVGFSQAVPPRLNDQNVMPLATGIVMTNHTIDRNGFP